MGKKRLGISGRDRNANSGTSKSVTVPACAQADISKTEESTAEKPNCTSCLCKTHEHNKHLSVQLQDVLKEQAETKEALKMYHGLLMSAVGSVDQLKGDIAAFQHLNTGLKSAESYKESVDQLIMENDALKTQMVELKHQIQSQKAQAFKSELDILDLRVVVARHKLESKKQEADYYIMKLSKIINQPNRDLPQSVYSNYEEFCSYGINCIFAQANLEFTYLRLKHHLRQGYSIKMSNLELRLPDFPQLCEEVSQYSGCGFQHSNRYEVPAHWIHEAPPPYSRYPPTNEDPHNSGDQVPSQREIEVPRSECEVTITSGLQAPSPDSASFAVSRTIPQAPLNMQLIAPNGSDPHVFSNSEPQISSGHESYASSGSDLNSFPENELHTSSSEPRNSSESELSPEIEFHTSPGSSLPQRPLNSSQIHRNGLNQAAQIALSTQLTRMMQRYHTRQDLRSRSSVQQPQQHSRIVPAQANDIVHFPVCPQSMRPINNLPQEGTGSAINEQMCVPLNPSGPVFPHQNHGHFG